MNNFNKVGNPFPCIWGFSFLLFLFFLLVHEIDIAVLTGYSLLSMLAKKLINVDKKCIQLIQDFRKINKDFFGYMLLSYFLALSMQSFLSFLVFFRFVSFSFWNRVSFKSCLLQLYVAFLLPPSCLRIGDQVLDVVFCFCCFLKLFMQYCCTVA